jgi:DNA-binding CsgD family transcriptional regulator
VFVGQENANHRMQEFLPDRSIWGLIPAGFPAADPALSPDRVFLEKGVEFRSIYNERNAHSTTGEKYISWIKAYGAKVRTLPSIPLRMIIFDGESVALPLDPENNRAGVVVHHSADVVNLATTFFEQCWRHANEIYGEEPDSDTELTAQEAELLQLLVQGATDEQAGRKLGVSLRTVRRMAAKLSERAGASGRFELGVRAAQRGWVR